MPSRVPRTAVVVLAAGSGTRVGAGRNKILLPLGGRPVVAWSLATAAALSPRPLLLLVVAEADRSAVAPYVDADVQVVTGGATRHESEWRALQVLAPAIDDGAVDLVVIHDAARPLAPARLFDAVIQRARELGAAIPGRVQHDLVARDSASPLGPVLAVQTPQAFRAGPLLDAFRHAERDGFSGTDTASCLERYTDVPVGWVSSPATNVKITFADDLAVAERLLRG